MLQEQADQALQQAKLRVTPQRVEVLAALMRAEDPITADRVVERVKGINRVTVYRILDQFVQAGLARPVRFSDEAVRFEYLGNRPHHHHLVCDNCGRVDDVAVKQERQIAAAVARQHRFKIREHSLEFFGLCRTCQS